MATNIDDLRALWADGACLTTDNEGASITVFETEETAQEIASTLECEKCETIPLIELLNNGYPADKEFVAEAGEDWGVVKAWKISIGSDDSPSWAVSCGDEGGRTWSLSQDVDNLHQCLIPDTLHDEERALAYANVLGVDKLPDPGEGRYYGIIVSHHYAGGHSVSSFLLQEGEFEAQTFKTVNEAQAWIAEQKDVAFTLAPNEIGQPNYKIVSFG